MSQATASTAVTGMSVRDSNKFKKEARQMFQKMAATIDLNHYGALPSRNENDVIPSLKD